MDARSRHLKLENGQRKPANLPGTLPHAHNHFHHLRDDTDQARAHAVARLFFTRWRHAGLSPGNRNSQVPKHPVDFHEKRGTFVVSNAQCPCQKGRFGWCPKSQEKDVCVPSRVVSPTPKREHGRQPTGKPPTNLGLPSPFCSRDPSFQETIKTQRNSLVLKRRMVENNEQIINP